MEQTIIAIGVWIVTRTEGDWALIGACVVLVYCLDVLIVNPILERVHRETWL